MATSYDTFANLTKKYLTNCLIGSAHLTGEGTLTEHFDDLMEEVITRGEIALIEVASNKYLATPKLTQQTLLKEKVPGENGKAIEPITSYEFTLLDNSNLTYQSKDLTNANPDSKAISEGKQGINPQAVKFQIYEPKEFQEEKYPKPTLMPKKRKFTGYCESLSENTTGSLKKAKGAISLSLGGLGVNMNINCCHVALALVVIILPLVALLTNRTLKAEARVTKLEKKNGKEQKQINELKLEQGIKPSQLKKPRKASQASTPASSPPVTQTHLTNLQRATAQLDQAQEQIKELQNQPNQLSQEIATALKEANQKIREQEKIIEDLQNQNKTPTNTKPQLFTCSHCQQE
ncbi:2235_t:CDS:2 [Entrophospora sp. SA101]|nr:2235_t:CDS:2 [Entrophospora sp. SA101]